jgi:hypothetical protein
MAGDQPRAAPAPGADHQSGPAAGSRTQMKAPHPVQLRPGEATGPRTRRTARRQPIARPQHQSALRLHDRHGPPVCRALELLSHVQALPPGRDAVRARLPVVVQPVPAVPAAAAASHLHQPGPDLPRWRRKDRGHRRPAVGIRDELIAGIPAGGLLSGGAPGQHSRPEPEHVQPQRGARRPEAEQKGSGSVSTHILSVAPQRPPGPKWTRAADPPSATRPLFLFS